MLKSRISLLLILLFPLAFAAQGQVQVNQSAYAYALDSTMNKWTPTGIRVGMDIAGPIYSLLEPSVSRYEITTDIDLHKFFGVIEIGHGSYKTGIDSANYTSNGFFYRVGMDANFIAKDPNLNVFFFGLRYASSLFNENMSGNLPSSGWGTQTISLEQNSSRASWAEMNIGMRVRIWKSIFAGYTARLKILKHNTYSKEEFQSYYIPGFGKADRTTNWGFSYYIQYRFEWKKKPIPWRKN